LLDYQGREWENTKKVIKIPGKKGEGKSDRRRGPVFLRP